MLGIERNINKLVFMYINRVKIVTDNSANYICKKSGVDLVYAVLAKKFFNDTDHRAASL